MKELKKQHLEMLQLLESIEVMLQNGNSIHPDSVIRGAIRIAIGMDQYAMPERLDNDELTMEELNKEIEKAQAVATIGSVIIQSAKIEVDYIKATGMIESSSELFKGINEQKRLS